MLTIGRRAILTVMFLLIFCGTAVATENEKHTTEIFAFGLNGYLVFLEISDVGDYRPSRMLGGIGMATGALTLALKGYDDDLFSGLLTAVAVTDIVLGLTIVIRARSIDKRGLSLHPVIKGTPSGPAAGLMLRFG